MEGFLHHLFPSVYTFYHNNEPYNCVHFQRMSENENERRNTLKKASHLIRSFSKTSKENFPSVHKSPRVYFFHSYNKPISIESQLIFSIIMGCSDIPYHFHSTEGTRCMYSKYNTYTMPIPCTRSWRSKRYN